MVHVFGFILQFEMKYKHYLIKKMNKISFDT